MKQYTGTKTLKAKPMTLGEYNELRGWTQPENDSPAETPGYLVEYQDGGKANHADFSGYISWSPADIFEKFYHPSETHQERVHEEKRELDDKAKKLSEFIGKNPLFEKLGAAEQERMKVQNDIMWQYSEVLGQRIAAFNTQKQ